MDKPKDKDRDKLKTKFRAIMLLHALGDTIGFKNGQWEFNYMEPNNFHLIEFVNELIYEFIALGGVNGINLDGWKVSDDTFLHIAISRSLLSYKKKNGVNKKFISIVKKDLFAEFATMAFQRIENTSEKLKGMLSSVDLSHCFDSDGKKIVFNRWVGIATYDTILQFSKTHDARNEPYNAQGGGSGAAMRNLCIGMCFYGEKNRDHLIDISVITSQLTHNNPLGYLAGFNAALFTALAMENVHISKWPYILLEYLNTDKLKKFLSLDNLDQVYDYNTYIRYWHKYIDTKFDKDGNPLKIRANTNPMHRFRYYFDNFYSGDESTQVGSAGYLCMIMAYDALLDCDGCWEKLIVYGMLNPGDSDTIGAVAAGLYGAMYNFGDVPDNMLKYLERKDEINDLAIKLYHKYKQKD